MITASDESVKPNLYAMLVGIGAYERVRPLRGPVNDVRALTSHLLTVTELNLNLLVLTDQRANKAAIIDGFQHFLTQAGSNDTVLVYFSGHGTQEEADPALWPTEADGQLECLVCHDAPVRQGEALQTWDFLLADKELRYLIAPISATGAHVVTLFDCCHAGDNTRSADLLATALEASDVRERRLTQVAPRRPYNAFCFHDRISAGQLTQEGIAVALPQGVHIQMAACESDECAVEVNGEGIFTKNLLAVLQAAHGQVSYQDLHNRVRQYMRFGYEQRPRVYVPDLPDAAGQPSLLLTRGFLNVPIQAGTLTATAVYNKQEGWLLDVGAIYGVSQNTPTIQLSDSSGQLTFSATVSRVGADYTVLALADDDRAKLDKTIAYRATIMGLLTEPVRLHLVNHGGPDTNLPMLIEKLAGGAGQNSSFFIPTDDEETANYTLNIRNGLYYITRPGDENRPLIRPLQADDPNLVKWLTSDLRHLAQWTYLRQLHNPAVDTPQLAVDLTVAGHEPIALAGTDSAAPVSVSFTRQADRWSASLTITLTNPTSRPLYCTAMYLSRDFMSFTGFLPTNHRIEAGQSVALGLSDRKAPTGRQASFRLKLEEVVRQYNWPVATESIKLLITTDPLSETTLSFLTLDELPSPPVLADRLSAAAERGGFETEAEEAEPFPDWSTQTITLNLINPLFNRVQAEELSQMLEMPADPQAESIMADFALGLYYELDTSNPLKPGLKLRDDLQLLVPDEGERGLWTDLKLAVANGVATRIQNRQYEQNLIRYPDRLRIVAEGDSWFQYPFLLRDVVDYLSGVYSVFSVAAAGDTLDDYLKTSRFLEAIAQVKPAFFLLSGGGNDLLGDTFTELIRDTPDPGLTVPERYLADAYRSQLAAVADRYRRILRLVQQGYPAVQVLVHGYDYVIPVDTAAQDTRQSWLGKTLVAKGVSTQAEREAIMRYLLDAFNEQLKQLAADYPNVTYLDLRGTVRRSDHLADYWCDEIHPNDKGFLSVATRFVEQINRLKA